MSISNTASQFLSGVLHFINKVTGEHVFPMADLMFEDDFIGAAPAAFPTAATAGTLWVKKIVKTAGTVTVGAVANGAGGQAQLATDATSEKQDAVLYFADNRGIDVSKIGGFEARVQLGVIPTAGTKAVCGVAANWADGPDTITQYLRFAVNGNGTLLVESQDGVTQTSVSSGVTVATTTEWHLLRIDWSDPTNVQFFIDGARVVTASPVAFAATGANAVLQPYASAYKASGTSVGTVNIDFLRTWMQRTAS